MIRDLGSTNGTRVNGQRVRRAALLPNDQLQIASFKFKVYLGPGEAPPAPDEHTMAIDGKDLAELAKAPAQPNPLPDVYPDNSSE